MHSLLRIRSLGLLILIVVFVVACGEGQEAAPEDDGTPADVDDGAATEDDEEAAEDPEDEPTEMAGAGCTNDAILQEVMGLAAADREARLQELAADEGDLLFYTTTGEDDLVELIAGFEEKYGFGMDVYTGTGAEVIERALREVDAGRAAADALEGEVEYMLLLDERDGLAFTESPHAENLLEDAVPEGKPWYDLKFNVLAVLYNSDLVAPEDMPKRAEDLRDYDGPLGVRFGNEDHMIAIIKYWQEEQGMTEEEGIEIWREILGGDNVYTYTSNTPMVEALHAGELGMAIALWHYHPRYHRRGPTPIEWEPATEPLVFRPNSIGVMCDAPHPAKAMLLQDFLISEDGQRIFADVLGRDVTHKDILSGTRGSETEYEYIVVDAEEVLPEQERWFALFEEMTRGATQE
jgi:iron(III) transport system substrate-binding protein